MDTAKEKFNEGDTVYVLISKRIGVSFEIVEKTFIAYSRNINKKISLYDFSKPHNTINILPPHRVFKSIEDAMIYGIICFIQEKEPNININKNIDVFDQYIIIERKHPHLILKYMDYIIVG